MSMKNAAAPRRVYLRAGIPLICVAGLYFGNRKSTFTIDEPVTTVPAKRDHGKARLTVTQGDKVEVWTEQHIVFGSRKPTA
jgi:hypothetical protein